MRRSVLAVAVCTLLAPSLSWADALTPDRVIQWEGRFRFTITRLETEVGEDGTFMDTVRGLSLGDSYEGFYRYSSPTGDGDFRAAQLGAWDGGYLESFYAPIPSPFDGDIGPSCSFSAAGGECGDEEPRVTIVGGHVVAFDWSAQFGGLITGFYGPQAFQVIQYSNSGPETYIATNTFKYRIDAPPGSYRAWGILELPDPKRVPEPSTLLLMGVGLAALSRVRQRRRLL